MAGNRAREIIKLPSDTKRELEGLVPKMGAIQDAIKVMKELGMDTSQIENQLNWAEKTAKTMLSEFG